MDVDGHEAGLEGDAAADGGLEDGFEGAHLAFGVGGLPEKLVKGLAMAGELDGGLCSHGHEAAEDQHAASRLYTGKQGENGVVLIQWMFGAGIEGRLPWSWVVIDDSGEAVAVHQREVGGRSHIAQRGVFGYRTDKYKVAEFRLIPGNQQAALQGERGAMLVEKAGEVVHRGDLTNSGVGVDEVLPLSRGRLRQGVA